MANKRSQLALLGGPKIFPAIPPRYNWPVITKSIENAVVKQLHESISIYNRGGIFEKFEDSFAKYHGGKHALLCSSGTLAIHSMFVAANFKPGDEVICPAYTFFATVTPLLFTGAKPVLCDCDENGNISPSEISKKITPKTKAVVITHMWGVPCQMDEIVKICQKNKLLLLEDCSHAHGAKYKNKSVGSFGNLAAWSLQGPKNISGGEGGILVTDNDEFYYHALLLGHYNKRCKQEIPKNHPLAKYSVTGMGLKYRAHPLAIAIAFELFKKIDQDIDTRNKFAQSIIKALKKYPGIEVPEYPSYIQPSWYALILKYHPEKLGNLSLDKFFEAIQAEGLVEADLPGSTCPLNLLPLFQTPQFLFPDYKNHPFSYKPGNFPIAEKYYKNIIKLPIWAERKDSKIIDGYISGFQKVLNNYRDLLKINNIILD